MAAAVALAVDLAPAQRQPFELVERIGAARARNFLAVDLLAHPPQPAFAADVGVELDAPLAACRRLRGDRLAHPRRDMIGQGLRRQALAHDDLQHLAHRIALDDVAVETEDAHAALGRQVQQHVAGDDELLQGGMQADAQHAALDLLRHRPLDARESLTGARQPLGAGRVARRPRLVQLEPEERRVGRELGEQELVREVVDAARADALERRRQVGVGAMPFGRRKAWDGQLRRLAGALEIGRARRLERPVARRRVGVGAGRLAELDPLGGSGDGSHGRSPGLGRLVVHRLLASFRNSPWARIRKADPQRSDPRPSGFGASAAPERRRVGRSVSSSASAGRGR